MTLEAHRAAAEKEAITTALIDNQYNQCHAAVALGVHRNTLHRLMREHHIGVKPVQRAAAARQAYYDSQRMALATLGIV